MKKERFFRNSFNKLRMLQQNGNIMKYFRNSLWMFSEYMLKIVSAIFVTIYIARFLGPDQFGILSYALAVVAIFMAISRLGMESILVRDLAQYPGKTKAYMGTAFGLMVVSSVVSLTGLAALVNVFESDNQTRLYIIIISIGLVFQTILVVDYGFQAKVKTKYASIAKSIALVLSSILKVCLVWWNSDLVYFVIAFAFDYVLIAISLLIMHFTKRQPNFFFQFDKSLVFPLLKSSWPMVLAAVATMLYMRIDQVMIKNMLDSHQLGLYSATMRIFEGWMIVPYVISLSLLPAIVKLKAGSKKAYEVSLTKLFALVFWPGVFIAVVATFEGEAIIRFTFGDAYSSASGVLTIVMWTAAFTALGSVTARYLTVEGMEKKIAFRTFFALIINVILNFILIPIYGIEGAAMATLITIIMANYFINYLDQQLKPLLKICNKAMMLKLM